MFDEDMSGDDGDGKKKGRKNKKGGKSGGKGGSRPMRGGNPLMKCAVADEMIKHGNRDDDDVCMKYKPD